MLIDTHAHLYWDSYRDDLDEVIKRSIEAGVTTVINVGVDVQLSQKALRQAQGKLQKIPENFTIYSTIGIHPHEALRYTQGKLLEDIKELEKIYLSNPKKVVAVGECGLDYKEVDEKQKILQRKLFQAQIDLAKKLNLPLLVHCRDDRSQNPENYEAWNEVLDLVGAHPTVLHCYSGTLETTKKILLSPTLIISFAGTLTYPKNEYLREAVKLLPLEQIVLETDCPFLPPQSERGQRNEPANVKEIAQMIADLKGITLEEVAKQTTINASRILAL